MIEPIGNYEHMADKYAAQVDTKGIHIHYERPHTWSLLPKKLTGLRVLDIGCGSGWYAEQLAAAGADVTAIDASATMVELTQQRLKDKARILQANIEQPMDYFADAEFDLVVAPLVIHYVQDWQKLFFEIARILKSGGQFVFSTHHPYGDYQTFKLENYFATTLITDYWKSFDATVQFYHHSMQDLMHALLNAGFVVEQFLESLPMPAMEKTEPDLYPKMLKRPQFLFMQCQKK
jgi:ubiquinone/menaquinone biosynthesis C-methylase UbiE